MISSRPGRASCAAPLGLLLAACGGGGDSTGAATPLPPEPLPPPPAADTLAFVGVDVVPMDSEMLLLDQTVVLRNRRIEVVGSREEVSVPEDATTIDGSGRVLMPGLADMHVHLDENDLPAYLAAGVTSVRNMWGYSAIRDLTARIAAGTVAGPVVYSTSPGIDGPPAKWPVTQIVETPTEARATVARLVAEGWTMLKVYQDLRPEVYAAVTAAAADAARGVENRRTFVGALHDAYVPILLGTDSGIDIVAPGTSLHDELQELVAAGLTPYEALAAGTVVAAAFLGEEDEFGAVREVLRADLLLLSGNPLEDVRVAAQPLGVVANGAWYPID